MSSSSTSPDGWPKAVKLNSRWWKVRYVDKTHPQMEYDEAEENHNLGTCDIVNRVIYIENSQSPDSMYDTLIHECMHACFATSPAPVPMKDDERLEEECVLWATEAMIEICLNMSDLVERMIEHFHAPRFLGPPTPR